MLLSYDRSMTLSTVYTRGGVSLGAQGPCLSGIAALVKIAITRLKGFLGRCRIGMPTQVTLADPLLPLQLALCSHVLHLAICLPDPRSDLASREFFLVWPISGKFGKLVLAVAAELMI